MLLEVPLNFQSCLSKRAKRTFAAWIRTVSRFDVANAMRPDVIIRHHFAQELKLSLFLCFGYETQGTGVGMHW